MPILSKIRSAVTAAVRFAQANVRADQQIKVPVRYMGGHNMIVRPSLHPQKRLIDDVLYFTLLGAVPLGLITTYLNVRIGPAELRDTPEGYVPERHEYERLPVTRFLSKYVAYNCFERNHERTLYYLHKADEKRKIKKLKQEIKKAQEEKKSQKGWYFVPTQETLETRIESAESIRPLSGSKTWK